MNDLLNDWPLSKLTVVDMSSFCGAGLIQNQKVFGFPHNNHATIVPVGTSCLKSQYYSIQILNYWCFFHYSLHTPLVLWKVSSRGNAFRSVLGWFFYVLQSVRCVFTNRVFPSGAGGQCNNASSLCCYRNSGNTLTKHS